VGGKGGSSEFIKYNLEEIHEGEGGLISVEETKWKGKDERREYRAVDWKVRVSWWDVGWGGGEWGVKERP